MILRDYQQECHDCVIDAFRTHRSTMVVIPTGGGKTVCFAHIIKTMQPARALVLAHRDELIYQAKDKIERVTGLPVEIEKAELAASTSLFHRCPVVVSSVQTQISGPRDKRRYMRFKPEDYGLLICDENHHSVSKSWREVISYYQRNPNLKLMGCTATPDRSDKAALGQVFESVAFDYGILDAIKDGWLVDITQQFVPVSGLDFSHVRTTAGDLNEGDLAKVMELEENVQGICQPSLEAIHGLAPKTLSKVPVPEWRDYLTGLKRVPRRSIGFTVSVAQAEMCANVFSRAMDGVEWVCGATNKEKRSDTLRRFSSGETHVVINCGVLLEGFDNPGVELIIWGRPTKSRALYCQGIGRSTRPLPGIVDGIPTADARRDAIAKSPKPFCRILDFIGTSGRHKLISCADILGGHVSEQAAEIAKAKAQKEGKPVRIMVTMTNAEAEIEKKKREAVERARQREEARKAHLVAKVDFSMQDVNPFSNADRFKNPETRCSIDGRAFSEKQCAILRKIGCDPNKLIYRQGQAIIADYFSKPTGPQKSLLIRAGYTESELKSVDSKGASVLIEQVKANHWKKPVVKSESEVLADYIR